MNIRKYPFNILHKNIRTNELALINLKHKFTLHRCQYLMHKIKILGRIVQTRQYCFHLLTCLWILKIFKTRRRLNHSVLYKLCTYALIDKLLIGQRGVFLTRCPEQKTRSSDAHPSSVALLQINGCLVRLVMSPRSYLMHSLLTLTDNMRWEKAAATSP